MIKTLKDIGVENTPQLMIFNKLDEYRKKYFDAYLHVDEKKAIEAELKENFEHEFDNEVLFISAKTGENIQELRGILKKRIGDLYEIRYPYQVKHW